MFTGIVEEIGQIVSIQKNNQLKIILQQMLW